MLVFRTDISEYHLFLLMGKKIVVSKILFPFFLLFFFSCLMQYNKSDFQGGMKLKFFSVTAPEKKEVETYSNVKNVLKCCPHSLLLKAVHFFLLSPLL